MRRADRFHARPEPDEGGLGASNLLSVFRPLHEVVRPRRVLALAADPFLYIGLLGLMVLSLAAAVWLVRRGKRLDVAVA
jgi:hypothetical protein